MKMSGLDWAAWWLVFIGAVNWGLFGLVSVNVIESVLGTGGLVQLVYILIGLAGLWELWKVFGTPAKKK